MEIENPTHLINVTPTKLQHYPTTKQTEQDGESSPINHNKNQEKLLFWKA